LRKKLSGEGNYGTALASKLYAKVSVLQRNFSISFPKKSIFPKNSRPSTSQETESFLFQSLSFSFYPLLPPARARG
jgi:hypothetical protein